MLSRNCPPTRNSPVRTVIDPALIPAVQWNNGGGVTREVAASPPGATFATFDWRLSVADIVENGPFSSLPGVDRHSLMVSPGEVRMTIDGQTQQWEIGAGAAFPGEADVRVEVLKGPTRNLNLITRRGRCKGSIALHRLNEPLSLGGGRGPVAVLVLAGSVGLQDGTRLEQSHLLLPGTGDQKICGRDSLVALVHVEATSKMSRAAETKGQDPPDQHMLPPRINRTSEVLDCRPPQNALSRGPAPNITRILADVGKPSRQMHGAQ
jgi:environmental stress-induced protein Ves